MVLIKTKTVHTDNKLIEGNKTYKSREVGNENQTNLRST